MSFRYNYSHHAKIGHELKTRAHENLIVANRLMNEGDGMMFDKHYFDVEVDGTWYEKLPKPGGFSDLPKGAGSAGDIPLDEPCLTADGKTKVRIKPGRHKVRVRQIVNVGTATGPEVTLMTPMTEVVVGNPTTRPAGRDGRWDREW